MLLLMAVTLWSSDDVTRKKELWIFEFILYFLIYLLSLNLSLVRYISTHSFMNSIAKSTIHKLSFYKKIKKMATSTKWLPLESNPDMLTSFIRALGVAAPARFVDIWSLEEDTLDMVPQPILAICVLYPSDDVDEERKKHIPRSNYVSANGSRCLYIRQRLVRKELFYYYLKSNTANYE